MILIPAGMTWKGVISRYSLHLGSTWSIVSPVWSGFCTSR